MVRALLEGSAKHSLQEKQHFFSQYRFYFNLIASFTPLKKKKCHSFLQNSRRHTLGEMIPNQKACEVERTVCISSCTSKADYTAKARPLSAITSVHTEQR